MSLLRSLSHSGPKILISAGLVLALSITAVAQSQSQPVRMGPGDARPDKVELQVLGGGSFFSQVDAGLGTKQANGGAMAGRVNINFWKYVGLEGGFTYSVNNEQFLSGIVIPGTPPTVSPQISLGTRLYQYNFNPVFHFTERGSKVRPYLTAGVSAMNWQPTDNAKAWARFPQNRQYGAQGLDGILNVGMNMGGGVKWHITDHFGIVADVRGLWTRNPTFKLPNYNTGGLFIPSPKQLWGVQTLIGLNWYFGQKAQPLPPPPPPPPAVVALGALSGGSLSTSGVLCQGQSITVSSNASDPAGRPLTYKWTANGQPVGGNSSTLTWTPSAPGAYKIEVEVSAANAGDLPTRIAKSQVLTLNVQPYNPPTARACAANPGSIPAGATSALSFTPGASACSTIASTNWTVSEGSVSSPSSASTTFNSANVRFEQSGKVQTKTVKATATVTDSRGATAQCATNVTVTYTPQPIRLADLIFAKSSNRVNNCAKRILLEELAPRAADPDYDVVIIGHHVQDEIVKGKKATTLDMERVVNTVAVLTGGKGTCGTVNVASIKTDWVGTTQTSDKLPGLCGTSTRQASKERKGSLTTETDSERRVEIWLVPKGVPLPAAWTGGKTITPQQLQKAGCPK